jgi:hypothetical protein
MTYEFLSYLCLRTVTLSVRQTVFLLVFSLRCDVLSSIEERQWLIHHLASLTIQEFAESCDIPGEPKRRAHAMRLNAHTRRRAGVAYCTVWVRHSQRANAVRNELGSQTRGQTFQSSDFEHF